MQTGARQHFRFFGGRALGERPHAHAAGVRRAEAGDVGERARYIESPLMSRSSSTTALILAMVDIWSEVLGCRGRGTCFEQPPRCRRCGGGRGAAAAAEANELVLGEGGG